MDSFANGEASVLDGVDEGSCCRCRCGTADDNDDNDAVDEEEACSMGFKGIFGGLSEALGDIS